MIGIVGLKIFEEQLLRAILFELVVFGDLSEGVLGRRLIDTEELTGLHPFVPTDVTIVIQVQHVKCRVDAFGELPQDLRIGVGLLQFFRQALMKIQPFV